VFGALSAGFAPTNPRRESSLHNPRSDQICDWTVGEYQFFCQFSLEFSIFVFNIFGEKTRVFFGILAHSGNYFNGLTFLVKNFSKFSHNFEPQCLKIEQVLLNFERCFKII
jgi:hypothetical protein